MTIYAYLRGSNESIHIANQQLEIGTAFPETDIVYFSEIASGSIPAQERPVLSKLLSLLKKGDTLLVTEMARIGRDAIDVLHTVTGLMQRGVKIRVIRDQNELKSEFHALLMTLLAAFAAEKEKADLVARTKAGQKTAVLNGKILGKPKGYSKLASTTQRRIIEAMQGEGATKTEIALRLKVSRGTLDRYLKGG